MLFNFLNTNLLLARMIQIILDPNWLCFTQKISFKIFFIIFLIKIIKLFDKKILISKSETNLKIIQCSNKDLLF